MCIRDSFDLLQERCRGCDDDDKMVTYFKRGVEAVTMMTKWWLTSREVSRLWRWRKWWLWLTSREVSRLWGWWQNGDLHQERCRGYDDKDKMVTYFKRGVEAVTMIAMVTYFKRGVEAVKKWKNSWCSSSHICIMNAQPLRTWTPQYTIICYHFPPLTQSACQSTSQPPSSLSPVLCMYTSRSN